MGHKEILAPSKIKISPIFYMGNKKKLINKGLIKLFPKDIHTFIDLFAGSGIVAMNTTAKEYIINDTNDKLFSLYNLFKNFDAQFIINNINNNIDEFGLARERTKRNEFKDIDKINQYKTAYHNLRENYNTEDSSVFKLYTLMFYAFSQQMRFNSKGKFNMPCGNDCFSEKNKEYIVNGCEFFKSNLVKINKSDFRNLKIGRIKLTDFVYFDPPYFNTTATYNENSGWLEQDENDLYKLCEELNAKGIKWGLSNIFENKGVKNHKLIDWCYKNNWSVYTFNNFTYMACGKGNSNSKEVFICNY